MSATVRRAAVGVLGLVPLAVVAVTAATWWDRLPAQLPTHWGLSGPPDDFGTRGATLAWAVVPAAVGGLLVVAALWTPWYRRSPSGARFAVAAGGFTAGLFAGIWVATVGATLAADSAAEATLGWSRVIGPMWLTWVVVGATVPQVVLAVLVPVAVPFAVLFVVLTLLCARVEVTVDHRGVRVVAGLVRLPIERIPLDRVEHATVEDVRAGDRGGWGYRVMPGRSALVLRSGPGLVITQADGRRFAATVDDPDVPAGLLNGLVAAQTA